MAAFQEGFILSTSISTADTVLARKAGGTRPATEQATVWHLVYWKVTYRIRMWDLPSKRRR